MKISRRSVLHISGLAAAALALTGCSAAGSAALGGKLPGLLKGLAKKGETAASSEAASDMEPKSATQIKNLAESLDLFDLAPGAHTPQEYGKYMIQQSGRFEYDENLDAFYDYERYGTERMNAEDGMFTDRGYVAYKGFFRMEEVMENRHKNGMEMGGLSR